MLRHLPPNDRTIRHRQFPDSIANTEQFDRAVDNGILSNLLPETPFISRETPVVTIGSCFARNIAADLIGHGYRIHRVNVSERLFSPFALRDFVVHLCSENLDIAHFIDAWRVSQAQIEDIRRVIVEGAVVILTFGLSFVWFDTETDEIIFDPTKKVGLKLIVANPERYEMRATEVPENFEAIVDVIEGLRRLNPFTKVIATLSPVPLHRAISDYPVIVADTISKATLRCALHNVTMLGLKDVYYFPAYEILRGFASMADVIWFEDNQLSHIRKEWIAYTMSKFKAAYCFGETPIRPPRVASGLVQIDLRK